MSGSVPSWAVPGAKCVCVDDRVSAIRDWLQSRYGLTPVGSMDGLTSGAVYTIREVEVMPWGIMLHLWEITRPDQRPNGQPIRVMGFAIERFRPLVTRTAEQDIAEHFAHHLTKPREKALADELKC